MHKSIMLAYITNLILMLSTKPDKNFVLSLRIKQLSNCYKKQMSKNMAFVKLLKK